MGFLSLPILYKCLYHYIKTLPIALPFFDTPSRRVLPTVVPASFTSKIILPCDFLSFVHFEILLLNLSVIIINCMYFCIVWSLQTKKTVYPLTLLSIVKRRFYFETVLVYSFLWFINRATTHKNKSLRKLAPS